LTLLTGQLVLTPADVMLMSAYDVARSGAATCHCYMFFFPEILLLISEIGFSLENS
jgi:hypothetical protein